MSQLIFHFDRISSIVLCQRTCSFFLFFLFVVVVYECVCLCLRMISSGFTACDCCSTLYAQLDSNEKMWIQMEKNWHKHGLGDAPEQIHSRRHGECGIRMSARGRCDVEWFWLCCQHTSTQCEAWWRWMQVTIGDNTHLKQLTRDPFVYLFMGAFYDVMRRWRWRRRRRQRPCWAMSTMMRCVCVYAVCSKREKNPIDLNTSHFSNNWKELCAI